MLQHWVSEGEFYISGFVLHNFIETVRFACSPNYIEPELVGYGGALQVAPLG